MEEHNLLIISDLHLSEGLDPQDGKFSRLEDFLFDDALARFLRYHEEIKDQPRFGGRPWMLIVNGDLFDFLQVVSLPREGRERLTVKGAEGGGKLSRNERKYGLGTTAGESEWKLRRIAQGHPRFFAALGWFLAHGNHLAIVKGNHDINLYWPQVQERCVEEIKRAYTRERQILDYGPQLTADDLERVHFYPWFYYEPGRVYVEHGGQYEAANHFRDYLTPLLPNDPERLELPWGSLFVRYLFNKLEEVHPFADNIKPASRYLGWAFKTDPFGTIELAATQGWTFLRALWNVSFKTLASTLRHRREPKQPPATDHPLLPPDVTENIAALAKQRVGAVWMEWVGAVVRGLLSALMLVIVLIFCVLMVLAFTGGTQGMTVVYLGAAVLSYFLRRGLERSLTHIFESDYLSEVAHELERILNPAHPIRYIVMGHSHLAALERLGKHTWYVNTGAWVPVYQQEGPIEGREELTFFRLAWGYEGLPELLHWDDAAGAPARTMLR